MINPPGFGRPIGTIFCIGRNYAEHIRELANERPERPVVFLKPLSAVCLSGDDVILPVAAGRVDHEVELVLALGRGGRNVPAAAAYGLVEAMTVGIDVTARDEQAEAKAKGLPWTVAKGHDTFAVLGPFVAAPAAAQELADLSFSLAVGGELRQQGRVADMLFGVPEILAYLSQVFTLAPGDLVYTGTPAGVGPLAAGDRLTAKLLGAASEVLSELEVGVRAE